MRLRSRTKSSRASSSLSSVILLAISSYQGSIWAPLTDINGGVLRLLVKFAFPANKTLHWRQRLALAFIQAQRATVPSEIRRRTLRQVLTGFGIKNYCSTHGMPVKVIPLDPSDVANGSTPPPTLHVVIPPSAPSSGPTLLYFHGGGYVNPMRAVGHVPFVLSCAAASQAKEVVFVEYSLAPEYQYPTQLIQAIASFRYLVDTLKVSPDDMIIGGDSAGGNMVGALLAHLAVPSPYAAPLDRGGKKVRAALFVCPWTSMSVDFDSYKTNDGKDYLNRRQAVEFKDAWNPKEADVWANLSGAKGSAEVWDQVFGRNDSPGLVERAMVVVGTAEVLLGDCRTFGQNHLRGETVVGGRAADWTALDEQPFVYVECEGEVHVQAALDSAVGYEGGAMTCAILHWLKHS